MMNKYKLSIFAVVIIDSIIIKTFLNTRPQIFDIIFILLEIYLLELYIRKGNKKYLAVLPIISLLMINLHASIWPMLFVILVPYYLGRINLKKTTVEKYKIKPLIIVTILMLICGFINPYGINMMLYLFRSFGLKEINNLVMEMKPININNGFIAYILIFIVLLMLLSWMNLSIFFISFISDLIKGSSCAFLNSSTTLQPASPIPLWAQYRPLGKIKAVSMNGLLVSTPFSST